MTEGGQEVIYQAEIAEGQTLAGDGPLEVDMASPPFWQWNRCGVRNGSTA